MRNKEELQYSVQLSENDWDYIANMIESDIDILDENVHFAQNEKERQESLEELYQKIETLNKINKILGWEPYIYTL